VPLKFALALLFVAGCALGSAFAADGVFAPKSSGNGAFVDVFGSLEREDDRGASRPFGWADTFLKEKITLYSNGYFYHPRFLRYRILLAGALKQEEYRPVDGRPARWKSASGGEYDAKLLFLAEHPYNLELYAARLEPLFKEEATTEHNSVATRRGASFRFRKKPYSFGARFGNDSNRSESYFSDVVRLSLDGEYLKRFGGENQFSVRGAYIPSRFNGSSDIHGTAAESAFGSFVDWRRVRLESSLTSNSRDQRDHAWATYESRQFSWYEVLSADLPLNLRSDLSYRYQDNEITIPDAGAPAERQLTDTGRDLQFDLVHRLYQSLTTQYGYLDRSRISSGGEADFTSHSLALAYTKQIPRGRVLSGAYFSRGQSDNKGRSDVVDEPHAANAIPGSFTLGRQDVEPESIAVFLKSPLAPFDTIRLLENVEYTVAPVSNSYEIDLIGLRSPFVVPGTFDILVSYSLMTSWFELRTDTLGYNASVDLLDGTLTPYFSWAGIRSTLQSGTLPGGAPDSTTTTAGLSTRCGPLRARGEVQDLDWEISPYRSYRGEFQYVEPVGATTQIYLALSYLRKHFPNGTSAQTREAYTDTTANTSGNIRKRFPSQGVSLAGGYSYSRIEGRLHGDTYALNSSLSWKIGRLSLTAGASAYETRVRGGANISSERFHQYYYLNVRRDLF